MVEWKKLGDIANCYAGATPSTKVASYWENGMIPWMSSGEVHQGIVTHTASYITQLGYDNSSTKMLPKGTIVIALAGQGKTRGCVAITDIELCTNQSLCGIVLCNSEIINKYVYYFLRTRYNHLRKISSGEGTRGGLNLKMISEYEIPIPSLSEQQRIVEQLDTFTSSIENLKEQIAQRRKQYEYYRDQLLDLEGKEGVEMKRIKDVCRKICSGGTPSTSKHEYYGGSIPWLRTQEVDWKEISDTEIKITEEAIVNSSAKIIPENCVIVAMYGATAAKAAINKIPLSTNQACCNLEIDSQKAMYKYVFHWLCKEYQNLKAMGEGSQNNINGQKVKDYPIPVLPLSEQQRIVSILDTFEASIQNLEAQLKEREKQYEYYRNKLLTFE